jgi:hypothetical protein
MIYFGKIQFFYLPEFKISRSCPHWYIDTHCRIFENTYVFRIYFVYVSFYFVYGHPPPPRPVSNLSRVRVICGHSELNKIIIIAEGGGGEGGGGAESMGCFYKPINTSFIRLSPMLSFLFISLDIQIMEQSSLKCNYAGRNRNSSWIHSYRRIKASFKSVLKWD